MNDRRRHQRIRFSTPPAIKLGSNGSSGQGRIENISLSGMMARSSLPLEPGQVAGCEFTLGGSPAIDQSVAVVSRLGDLVGLRFQPGLANPLLLADAMADALACGTASVLAQHEINGQRVLRVSGGFNASLREDFLHMLEHSSIAELDLSGVTSVDEAGLALCRLAVEKHGVHLGQQAPCFARAWQHFNAGR